MTFPTLTFLRRPAALRVGRFLPVLAALSFAASPSPSRAQAVRELPYDLRVDLPISLGGFSLLIASEFAKPVLASEECRWCATNALDSSVADALRWEDTRAARRTSNWVAVGVFPLALLGAGLAAAAHDHALSKLPEDILFVSQAVAISGLLTQVVKFAAARERPFVARLGEEQKGATDRPHDNNLSFFSGHTSFAFSMAVGAGTVSQLRGYRLTPLVWAVGLPLAALNGYLRIAADRHYLTDVLIGAAVGSAAGALTPWLMHRPE